MKASDFSGHHLFPGMHIGEQHAIQSPLMASLLFKDHIRSNPITLPPETIREFLAFPIKPGFPHHKQGEFLLWLKTDLTIPLGIKNWVDMVEDPPINTNRFDLIS